MNDPNDLKQRVEDLETVVFQLMCYMAILLPAEQMSVAPAYERLFEQLQKTEARDE